MWDYSTLKMVFCSEVHYTHELNFWGWTHLLFPILGKINSHLIHSFKHPVLMIPNRYRVWHWNYIFIFLVVRKKKGGGLMKQVFGLKIGNRPYMGYWRNFIWFHWLVGFKFKKNWLCPSSCCFTLIKLTSVFLKIFDKL